MKQGRPIVLVGNALAVLVAAATLARRGADVVVVNPTRNWGGHFTTFEAGGTVFDPGMVLYEFTSFSPQGPEDVATYDPSVRNDVGRFCSTTREFVSNYQDTHVIGTPQMYLGGRFYDDVLIANALTSLPTLPFASAMDDELRTLPEPGAMHPSRKRDGIDYREFDYESASLANHGHAFHNAIIEPFCRKVLGIPTRDVLALYHRVPWLPLFYPETLRSFLQDRPQGLPPTEFSYPAQGCVGDLAWRLKQEIDANPRVTVLTERPVSVKPTSDGMAIGLSNDWVLYADHMAWGLALGDLLRATRREDNVAAYGKCSIALAFLRIPTSALRRDWTVLSVVDPELCSFRITQQSACRGGRHETANVVVEINPEYVKTRGLAADVDDLRNRIVSELVTIGLVADAAAVEILGLRVMPNVLMLPSAANRAAYEAERRSALAVVPDIMLLGPASGFFSSSLNDQIVQGLQVAAACEVIS